MAEHVQGATSSAGTGLMSDVVPDGGNSALAGDLFPRVLSPLGLEALRRKTTDRPGGTTATFPLTGEKFTLYVPAREPSGGYGLLVFIRPWEDAALPSGWASVLERRGIVFITAARSGNNADVLSRRMPLALAAFEYATSHYRIDRTRTYIGGFSGGSRVAFRLALDYPDVFRGAVLNAGSDPVGVAPLALPDAQRMDAFRSSRLVFVTGTSDETPWTMDGTTTNSLRRWCAFNFVSAPMDFAGHEIAGAANLDRALGELAKNGSRSAPARTCQTARQTEIDAGIARAGAALANGDRIAARRLILQLDGTYGGLAGTSLITLADRCGCNILPPAESAAHAADRN